MARHPIFNPSEPAPVAGQGAVARTHPVSGRKAYSRLNDAAAVYVVMSALLTAVPVGLNRPVLWLSWVALTAVVLLLYLLLGRRFDRDRGLLSARHPVLFGLALLVPVYALIQSVPGLGDFATWPPAPNPYGSETISLLPDASRMAALRFTGYILFAVLAIEIASRADRARRVAWWIFWGVVGHAVIGLTLLNALGDVTIWGGEKVAFDGAATGVFVSRNNFATFLGIGFVLGLALLYEQIDKPTTRRARTSTLFTSEAIDRALVIVGLAVIAGALFSTQSRAGVFVGCFGAAVCYLVMRAKAGIPVWRSFLLLFVLGGGAVLAAIPLYGQDLAERFIFLRDNAELRLLGYERVVALIEARPVSGFGFDGFRPAFETVHTAPFVLDRIWDRAHSTVLSNWVELGLGIGSLPILVFLFAAIRIVATIRKRERDYAIGVAGLSTLALTGAHSLTDFSLEIPAVTILTIAVVGLGLAHRTPATRRKETSDSQ